jgi:hypothetical protein
VYTIAAAETQQTNQAAIVGQPGRTAGAMIPTNMSTMAPPYHAFVRLIGAPVLDGFV